MNHYSAHTPSSRTIYHIFTPLTFLALSPHPIVTFLWRNSLHQTRTALSSHRQNHPHPAPGLTLSWVSCHPGCLVPASIFSQDIHPCSGSSQQTVLHSVSYFCTFSQALTFVLDDLHLANSLGRQICCLPLKQRAGVCLLPAFMKLGRLTSQLANGVKSQSLQFSAESISSSFSRSLHLICFSRSSIVPFLMAHCHQRILMLQHISSQDQKETKNHSCLTLACLPTTNPFLCSLLSKNSYNHYLSVLLSRTFWDGGNVLSLHCPILQPLASCSC